MVGIPSADTPNRNCKPIHLPTGWIKPCPVYLCSSECFTTLVILKTAQKLWSSNNVLSGIMLKIYT